jgi:adenine/guanine phosphoribosyltransferase-like PRPP-binding protein
MKRQELEKLASALEKAGWEIVKIGPAMSRQVDQGAVHEERTTGLDIQIVPVSE